jgi:hypothetical protein
MNVVDTTEALVSFLFFFFVVIFFFHHDQQKTGHAVENSKLCMDLFFNHHALALDLRRNVVVMGVSQSSQ